MPDGPDDLKEQIRAVLAQLENESYKNEVLRELKAAKHGTSLFQHPAFLLVLGFLLTGGVGTWLTSVWQDLQQETQRQQLAHEPKIQQQYELTNEMNKAAAEAYAGTQVMLHTLFYGREGTDLEMAEREAYWKQARRNWIVNSLVLQQKLAVTFPRDENQVLFQKIVDESENMGIYMDKAVNKLKEKKWANIDDTEVTPLKKQALTMANDMREHTKELLKSLVEDIHQEEGPS